MLDNKTSQTRDQVWSSQAPKCFLSHSQSTQARLTLKKSFQTSENTLKKMKTFQRQSKWLGHNTLGKQGNENN